MRDILPNSLLVLAMVAAEAAGAFLSWVASANRSDTDASCNTAESYV